MDAYVTGFAFIFLNILSNVPCVHGAKTVSMKIVDEPTNYGMNYGGGYQQPQADSSSLKIRVPPSNFSGPSHLLRLHGKCFSLTDESYRYELCPFANVTQHEQSLKWNPYSGVLGVWQEWEIENNTFVAMRMEFGDPCGGVFRSVRVLLQCGNRTMIEAVSEPSTCHYQMTLRTPLICHPHSLLVYPTLPRNLQREWDVTEGSLEGDLITHKGYKKRLRKIFEDAGYLLRPETKQQLTEAARGRDSPTAGDGTGEFDTLPKCSEEYHKLQQEVQGLRTLLKMHGISSDTENNKMDKEAIQVKNWGDEDQDLFMDYPIDDDYGEQYDRH